DVMAVAVPPSTNQHTTPAPEDIPLNTLYEDEHLVALDKPAGVVVHPGCGHRTGTLLNALLWRALGWKVGQRPSFVGRLDKGTSGIVIVAKSRMVHAALQRAMAHGRAQKDYLAVAYGFVKQNRGEITLRLARDDHDRRRIVASETRGMPSL